jgi:hypothetical protein
LPSQRAEAANIRDGERHAELIVVENVEIEFPILQAKAAAIGVVSDLR